MLKRLISLNDDDVKRTTKFFLKVFSFAMQQTLKRMIQMQQHQLNFNYTHDRMHGVDICEGGEEKRKKPEFKLHKITLVVCCYCCCGR